MKLLLLLLLIIFSFTNALAQIAYVRGGTEIRIIDPEGRNDRQIWTHPDAKPELGIYGLAWRPVEPKRPEGVDSELTTAA